MRIVQGVEVSIAVVVVVVVVVVSGALVIIKLKSIAASPLFLLRKPTTTTPTPWRIRTAPQRFVCPKVTAAGAIEKDGQLFLAESGEKLVTEKMHMFVTRYVKIVWRVECGFRLLSQLHTERTVKLKKRSVRTKEKRW